MSTKASPVVKCSEDTEHLSQACLFLDCDVGWEDEREVSQTTSKKDLCEVSKLQARQAVGAQSHFLYFSVSVLFLTQLMMSQILMEELSYQTCKKRKRPLF